MTDTDTMPPGWSTGNLGYLLASVSKTQPRKWSEQRLFGYLDIGSVDNTSHRIIEVRAVRSEEAPSRAQQVVQAGDVLFSTVRTYLENIAVVPDRAEFDDLIASTGFCVLRPMKGVNGRYLFYLCLEPSLLAAMAARQTGTSYPAIRDEDLRDHRVLVPPSAEQGRIAAEVERRLSHIDAAEASLDSALRKTQKARVAVLRTATDGSLLAFDLAGDATKECEAAGVAYETVADRPGWARVRLRDIAKVGSGATPKRGNPRYWDGGTIPWVTSGQVVGGVVHEPAELITDAALKETSVKLWPVGTLLVAMYGEGRTRGHCAELAIEATCNQACAAISLHPDLADAQPFVKLVLQARYEENRVLGSGGVQENLNLGLIRDITIDLPPQDVRNALGAEADRRLSLLAVAEAGIAKQRARCSSARRSVLSAAFAGRLVPQDPTDEPADQLLERISADRATATLTKRTRRRRITQETAK